LFSFCYLYNTLITNLIDKIKIKGWKKGKTIKIKYKKERIKGEKCFLYKRKYGVLLIQLIIMRNEKGAF